MRSILGKLGLMVTASFVGLLLVEGGLQLTGDPGSDSERTFFMGGRLIYDPVFGWRNKPGIWDGRSKVDERWVEMTYQVNSMGFRGPEITVEKPEGVTRIVSLGDSGTFGVLSVPDESASTGWEFRAVMSYPDELRERLAQEGLRHVEVINAGVIGYSSSHALRQFALQIVELDPDIVTLRVGANDSQYSWGPQRRAIEPSSALTRTLLHGFHNWQIARLALRTYQGIPRFHPKPNKAYWTTQEQFLRNLERITSISREHGFHLLLIDYPLPKNHHLGPRMNWFQRAIPTFARSHQIPLLSTQRHLKGSELFGTWDRVHPTERGAKLIADLLFERLRSLGWIDSDVGHGQCTH